MAHDDDDDDDEDEGPPPLAVATPPVLAVVRGPGRILEKDVADVVVLVVVLIGLGTCTCSCNWARHLTSSVGAETTQVASPPTAPASHVVARLVPRPWAPWPPSPLSPPPPPMKAGVLLPAVLREFRKASVRLYDTNSSALRAP
jgi:hypothetical protein